ncbi:protein NRT1/ PTR FAMILY 5.10 [Sesamum alatum]|uniref:Protein NRT1/ PTR FAMILY 5.10 n=1 Tax=Sesamum alatum TaxID=300844 RepID=A0AAE1XK92_9LAMI|nr:protein NRT1/ PTR FAMILY 5.10 [Sesamum alatum]
MATITTATGSNFPEAETPLLDVARGSVDFKGRPAARSKLGRWKSASFIIGVELAERFAYYGINSNLVSYLTGPLGQSTATAAANVNTWSGTAWLLPLLGAFIADSFLGRYRMILVASMLYILGLGFLSLSAALHSFKCPNARNTTACRPSQLEIIFFFCSLYLVALAQGGNKPCVQAFGADQFDEEDDEERLAKSSLFNWWNFFLSATVMLSLLVLNYIQENLSWTLGFGIPCVVMCFALIIFSLGTMTYRYSIDSDGRSPLVRISQVFVKTARNWRILPHEGAEVEALIEDEKVYFSNDIEAAKTILRLVPIWATCLGYSIVYSQVSTLFVKEAATMDRYITTSFQVPVASLQSFIGVSLIVFIPIYDRVLVPIARTINKSPSGISMLQRIGTGIFLSLLAMVIAALVETKRLAVAVEYGLVDTPKATVPMSVWWLAPQYLIVGLADVFTFIGLQEFFYDQVPSEFRSMGLALYLSIFGIGNFLSSFLISIVSKATRGHGQDGWFSDNLNRAHLDYFYWLLAGLSAVAFAAYLYFAKSYVCYRRISL